MSVRELLLVVAISLSSAIAEADTPTIGKPVWVRVVRDEIEVNGEVVPLSQLDASVMRQGRATNPDLSEREIRGQLRIYVGSSPKTSTDLFMSVVAALGDYQRLGILGEDAR